MSDLPRYRPLDESLYKPSPEQLAFLKQTTGIDDDAKLKTHIIKLQTKAFSIFPYPCIQRFAFTQFRIPSHPAYPDAIKLKDSDVHAIWVDCGCFFGTDARKIMLDGWPANRLIGTDLRQDFIELGKSLFSAVTASQTSPTFVAGDLLSDAFLNLSSTQAVNKEMLILSELASMTPLIGQVRVVSASALFHVFDEEKQEKLARRLFPLLDLSSPGAIILGMHAGMPTKGIKVYEIRPDWDVFCHSPDSWKEMWQKIAEDAGRSVDVQAALSENWHTDHFMLWSVRAI